MASEGNDKLAEEAAAYPSHWKVKGLPGHLKPRKFSSTSSLYIDSTITKPKNNEVMHCMAEYLCKKMYDEGHCSMDLRQQFEVYDESRHPLTSKNADTRSIPTYDTVEKYIKNIFKIGQLAHESLVMAIAYMERITGTQGFKLFPHNWRRVTLACLILASKVWEDQAVWNIDFIDLFPLTSPHDLGQMEKRLLSLLKFDVSLRASEYAKIYFDIRATDPHSGMVAQAEAAAGDHFKELLPLTKEEEAKLELRSSNYTGKHWDKKLNRSSGSVDDIHSHLTSPRSILN